MRICYILRHPESFFYSIERICRLLIKEVQKIADVRVFTMPFSSSPLGAPANLMCLPKRSNTVYHIIGDVHYAALALPKERTVVTLHDAVLLYRLSGLKRHILLEYSYRKPIQRAAAVTTCSQFSKSELEKVCGGLTRTVQVVHNPVDPIFLQGEAKPHVGKPIVLQVGSTPNKNADTVIKALAGSQNELHIVGRPESQLIDLSKRERVQLEWHTGINDQGLLNLYRSASVVTFASSYEGFGLPIVEAQAVGCPVITSTCCSLPEVAGDGALFVQPENVEELRKAIDVVIADGEQREKLIQRGRENVGRFSIQRIAAEYMAIYESLVN